MEAAANSDKAHCYKMVGVLATLNSWRAFVDHVLNRRMLTLLQAEVSPGTLAHTVADDCPADDPVELGIDAQLPAVQSAEFPSADPASFSEDIRKLMLPASFGALTISPENAESSTSLGVISHPPTPPKTAVAPEPSSPEDDTQPQAEVPETLAAQPPVESPKRDKPLKKVKPVKQKSDRGSGARRSASASCSTSRPSTRRPWKQTLRRWPTCATTCRRCRCCNGWCTWATWPTATSRTQDEIARIEARAPDIGAFIGELPEGFWARPASAVARALAAPAS